MPKPAELYAASGMEKVVQRVREEAGLPVTFTLDACRHGRMTKLEEAVLTDGQVGHYPRTRVMPTSGMPNAP